MKKNYLTILLLSALLIGGCESKESNEVPAESSSSETVQETISSSTKSTVVSDSTFKESSEIETSSKNMDTENHYNLVINDFKNKLYGEWTYTNSLADGMDFYREISEISFKEDGTYSSKMTSNKGDTNGVISESNGSYKISENGVKQTLEGLTHYVDNYDDFAKQDTGFRANYIQVRFTSSDKEATTGIYIYPNGHLTFENPGLLFNENVTGLSQFEKF